MWTAGIQMKWICDHRSESQFKQLRNSPKKSFSGLQRDSNLWPLRSAAVLYQPELWRPIHWEPANWLSSSTCERNETQNEMMWTARIQMKWICYHRSESQFKQLRNSPKKSFSGLQRDSFHSVFHSFHGLMNSIYWPALSVWVFIAQAGRALQRYTEATGSNPIEALKNFFRAISQLLKLRFTAMVTYSFQSILS